MANSVCRTDNCKSTRINPWKSGRHNNASTINSDCTSLRRHAVHDSPPDAERRPRDPTGRRGAQQPSGDEMPRPRHGRRLGDAGLSRRPLGNPTDGGQPSGCAVLKVALCGVEAVQEHSGLDGAALHHDGSRPERRRRGVRGSTALAHATRSTKCLRRWAAPPNRDSHPEPKTEPHPDHKQVGSSSVGLPRCRRRRTPVCCASFSRAPTRCRRGASCPRAGRARPLPRSDGVVRRPCGDWPIVGRGPLPFVAWRGRGRDITSRTQENKRTREHARVRVDTVWGVV